MRPKDDLYLKVRAEVNRTHLLLGDRWLIESGTVIVILETVTGTATAIAIENAIVTEIENGTGTEIETETVIGTGTGIGTVGLLKAGFLQDLAAEAGDDFYFLYSLFFPLQFLDSLHSST